MSSLGGARVALLEARRESELASLVRRHGGEPICVPALREVDRNCEEVVVRAVAHLGEDARAGESPIVVLATGVGLDRWLSMATALGRGDVLRKGLARATVVCRGPKPVAVLKREGLTAHHRAEPPHTTAELLAVLATIEVSARDVVYVHDGGGAITVPYALAERGAHVVEIQPYAWALPEDPEPLRELVRVLVAGGVDAVAITTQVQAKHLFEVARTIGMDRAMGEVLRERVIVAAVGPTCARTLVDLGVPPHVVPAHGKMGSLVLALADRIEAGRRGSDKL